MNAQALLTELLLSGFFAVAFLRAQGAEIRELPFSPRTFFALPDRLERLSRSRWQWFSMVLVLVVLRIERGVPMVAELTVLAQFVVFMLVPTHKPMQAVARAK